LRPGPDEVIVETKVHRATADIRGDTFEQELQLSRVGDTLYLDSGRVLRD